MGRLRARLTASSLFLLLLVCLPFCSGQDKPAPFLDPDEANSRTTEVVDALKLICPQEEIARDVQGNVTGCRHCPRQTADWDAEDLNWDLKRAFSGHFTAKDDDNILLTGRGCEPHSDNFGGTFVFNVKGTAVTFLNYDQALITERCHKFQARDVHDMLVCTDDWGAQATVWSYVYAVGFGADGESVVEHVFETIDRSRQKCGIDWVDDSPTSVQESHITGLELASSKGRAQNLYITASLGERIPTDEERKACEHGKPIPLTLNTYRLEFSFDGSTFRPSGNSRTLLKFFPEAESPAESYSGNH